MRSSTETGVETKRRSQNPKCKHDTEGEGGTVKLPWEVLQPSLGDC